MSQQPAQGRLSPDPPGKKEKKQIKTKRSLRIKREKMEDNLNSGEERVKDPATNSNQD